MKRTWREVEYETRLTRNDAEGWIAVELQRTVSGTSDVAARVVFWDAEGQFAFEVAAAELPLVIVEDLISEARSTIKVR
jgi:hypothetical protein